MKKGIILLTAILLLAFSVTQAQNKNWTGLGGDNLWSNAANWTGGTIPGAGSHVKIDFPATTVHLDVDATISSILFLGTSAAAGHLEIDAGFTLTTTLRGVLIQNSASTFTVNGTYAATTVATSYDAIRNNVGGTVTIGINGTVDIDNAANFGITSSGTIDNQGTINLRTITSVGINIGIGGSMTSSGEIAIIGPISNLFALRGNITSTGTISGNSTDTQATILNDVTIAGGILAPGMSVGQLSFRSAFAPTALVDYNVEIDKGAANSDELYFFNSGAAANILSNLDVVVTQLDATSLAVGDEFTIIRSVNGYTSIFNSIDYSAITLPASSMWVEIYNTNDVKIKIEAILPVKLTYFKADKQGNQAYLSWQTASETNNEGFEIQKSADARNWETIGFSKGEGESYRAANYTFTDESPSSGMNYYRLKQMDFDGQYDFSSVQRLNFRKENSVVNIFPNPSSGLFYIDFEGLENEPIKVFSAEGKLLMQKSMEDNSIDLSSLPQGVYFLEINKERKRVVVQ